MSTEPELGRHWPKKSTVIKIAGAAGAAAALGVGAFIAEKQLPKVVGSPKHIMDIAGGYSADVNGALDLVETDTVAHQEVAELARHALAAVLRDGRDAHTKEIRGIIGGHWRPSDWDPLITTLRILEAKGALEHPNGSGHELWQPTEGLQRIFSDPDMSLPKLREQVDLYRHQPPETPIFEFRLTD